MSEVDFLTDVAKRGDTVVYAGSAPGHHIPFLAELFDHLDLKWDLYDPREFELKAKKGVTNYILSKINTYQEYFLDEVARKYNGRDDILFITDIRVGTEAGVIPGEEQVEKDMAMQEQWIKIMQPRASMVKFRLNYSNLDKPYEYIDGEDHIQAWAPQTSSETRLISVRDEQLYKTTGDGFPRKKYNQNDYDARMYYINSVLREWGSFDHKLPLNMVKGLDTCYDCNLEVSMWRKYLRSVGSIPTDEAVADMMNKASTASRPLKEGAHGIDPDTPMVKKRSRIAKFGKIRGQTTSKS